MNLKVIISADDYLAETTVRKFLGDGVGLETIDSRCSTNAELELADIRTADAAFSTPPFLEPRKVTWWKNVHFLPGASKRGPAEEVKDALEKLADKFAALPLADNQIFVLSGPGLLKTSIFAKKLAGVAEILRFTAGKPWEQAKQAVVRMMDVAAEDGLKFAPGVAEAFVARVGVDTRSLMSEYAKIRTYLEPGASVITRGDVDAVSSPGVGVEPEIWSITDAIGARDLEAAVVAIRQFEGESGFAVMVTSVVERHFRQLYDLKRAAAEGRFDACCSGMNPYAVRKLRAALGNWSLGELRAARTRFLRLRERAVSSSGSVDPLVITTLVRVLRRGGRR